MDKEKEERVSVLLSESLVKYLDELAVANHLNRSQAIRMAIREHQAKKGSK